MWPRLTSSCPEFRTIHCRPGAADARRRAMRLQRWRKCASCVPVEASCDVLHIAGARTIHLPSRRAVLRGIEHAGTSTLHVHKRERFAVLPVLLYNCSSIPVAVWTVCQQPQAPSPLRIHAVPSTRMRIFVVER